jgi:hypothetical protein
MLQLPDIYKKGAILVSHLLNHSCNQTIHEILLSQLTFEGETILWSKINGYC